VYDEDLDNVLGIIYVKDLLEQYDEDDNFEWQQKMRRTVLFAPETKKIDELLREFQRKRAHMAVIVDEYGGSTGLVTLEDIMEEIVGEIRDEFDKEEETSYIKIAHNNFIFDGKVSLKEVCRIINVETNYFDNVRQQADSLGGLILELTGQIPPVDREIKVNETTMKVITVTRRRIEKISLIKS
jgi:putative hemolysin